MTEALGDEVRRLADRSAIADLVVRFSNAADARDLATMAACFLPGAGYEGGAGVGSIEQALEGLAAGMTKIESMTHLVGNQTFDIDGDRATCETVSMVWSKTLPAYGAKETTGSYRFRDELVRRDGGWRIARRKVSCSWLRDGTLAPPSRP